MSAGPAGFGKLGEEIVYRGSLISVAQAVFADPEGREFRRDRGNKRDGTSNY